MRAPFAHRKIAFLTAAVLASAGASTLMFSGVTPQIRGKAADLLAMMHDRSPGARAPGAKSNKHKQVALAAATPKRQSKVLPTAVPAATPAAAAPPAAGAATPIPAAIAPLAAVPAAVIPAAASSGGFFIPPLILPGGGGGGLILTPSANPPPVTPPPPVPGVPEPSTWAMMIMGFMFIGGLLRRRQRQDESRPTASDAVVSAR
jgi:hypothetical protein